MSVIIVNSITSVGCHPKPTQMMLFPSYIVYRIRNYDRYLNVASQIRPLNPSFQSAGPG